MIAKTPMDEEEECRHAPHPHGRPDSQHVDRPDEDHAARADQVREPDVDGAGVERPGLAGKPLGLDEVADRRAEDRQHARPGEPVAERRNRPDEREVLAPPLVCVQGDAARLVREHGRELGVDPVHEHGDQGREGPQGQRAPGADAPDRVPERGEQRAGNRHGDDEAVVPGKYLAKLPLLTRALSHRSPPCPVVGSGHAGRRSELSGPPPRAAAAA